MSETKTQMPGCALCGVELHNIKGGRKYCISCAFDSSSRAVWRKSRKPANDNEKAREITKCAVKVGFLPHPTDFLCADCQQPAKCYDHRDYNKPLDVEPVCMSCNAKRGRGVPLVISKH